MTDQNDYKDQHQSAFRSAGKRRSVVTDVPETQGMFKEEGVQLTVYPCFTYM